jgi:hypothetical protein
LQNALVPRSARGVGRLGVAFAFGLFHGLGFAGGLLAAMEGMAGVVASTAIAGFSLGVELGHQAVVLPIFGVLALLRRQAGAPVTPAAGHVLRYGSAAICAAGLFYLIEALR